MQGQAREWKDKPSAMKVVGMGKPSLSFRFVLNVSLGFLIGFLTALSLTQVSHDFSN
jgi:hypothetical protein